MLNLLLGTIGTSERFCLPACDILRISTNANADVVRLSKENQHESRERKVDTVQLQLHNYFLACRRLVIIRHETSHETDSDSASTSSCDAEDDVELEPDSADRILDNPLLSETAYYIFKNIFERYVDYQKRNGLTLRRIDVRTYPESDDLQGGEYTLPPAFYEEHPGNGEITDVEEFNKRGRCEFERLRKQAMRKRNIFRKIPSNGVEDKPLIIGR